MMYLIVVGLGALVSFGILILFRYRIYTLIKATVGLLNDMLADVSDEEKQKLLVAGLGKVLSNLFLVLLLVGLSISCFLIILYGYAFTQNLSLTDLDFESTAFYLSLAAGSIVPFVPLMMKKSESGYSESARLLHQMILDNQNLGKFLLQLEQNIFLKKVDNEDAPAIIISGLARAGTTALTTQLHELGDFYSLNYANMPFLMAPNLWKKIYNPKGAQKTERSHGDGLEFGLDSIEALEEYFWKSQLNDSFIESDNLKQHQVHEETAITYQNYQKLIRSASDSGSVYLAKNNNMMLRYESIKDHCQNLKVILLIRKPLDHANSLLKQHQRFCKMQREDLFVLEYMDWLGHHEFGLNQKEFRFDGQDPVGSEKESIDYWISVWTNYYTAIKKYLGDNQVTLIPYEDFLEDPKAVFRELKGELGLYLQDKEFDKFVPKKSELPKPTSPQKLEEADQLYNEIVSNHSTIKKGLN